MELEHDTAAWMMWHNALLSNADPKKFPKFEQFKYRSEKPVKNLDENAIMNWLKSYSERYKKECKSQS